MSSGSGQFYDLRGFIGVRFLIGSYLHYGWIDYSGTGSGEGTIHGWAYETTPYAAITACAPRCFLAPIQMLLLSP